MESSFPRKKKLWWKKPTHTQRRFRHRTDDKYGFKSRKCHPQHEDLDRFEADLVDMVNNIQFRKTQDEFQTQLNKDIQRIKSSTKAFIPADKTTNLYELDKTQHEKLVQNSITTTHKKASKGIFHSINQEAKAIATLLDNQDRTESIAERQPFISLKDHKENVAKNPTRSLINPAKSEIGRISKQILQRINTDVRNKTPRNQWKNSSSIIDWFKNIPDKHLHAFTVFDIESFYPSISESKCSVSKLVNWHMIFWTMFIDIWFREFCGWLSYLEYEQ